MHQPSDGRDSESTLDLTRTVTALWHAVLAPGQQPAETIKTRPDRTATPSNLVVREHRVAAPGEAASDLAPDYELLAKLGEGGMGVVYTARQTSVDRTVALKMIRPGLAGDEASCVKFLSEAAVTGDLDHPNIVPIHDLGTSATGALFYAMKRVQGTAWHEIIADKSLAENLEILLRVADAVAFAHSRGVIHRDLKPQNVMLGDFGEVLVMDWGLAVSVDPQGKAERLDQHSACAGTPAYMAPEMALGEAARIGKASDVYLLGAILHEIIAGVRPHAGTTVIEALTRAAGNVIDPGRAQGELRAIALQAMATDPQQRYPSVKAFQQALREYEAHAESIRLAERAAGELAEAERTRSYDDFSRALSGFQEALTLWPGNARAREGVLAGKSAFASCAMANGDLDLAASQLDPDEAQHRALAERVAAAQRERTARQRRLKVLTRAAVALVGSVLVILLVSFLWISAEQRRTEAARTLAEDEARRAQAINEFLQEMLAAADPFESGQTITVLEVMDEAAKKVDEKFAGDPKVRADVHLTLGKTYMSLGQYERSESHLLAAHDLRREIYSQESREYIEGVNIWVDLLGWQGRFDEAESAAVEALQLSRRVFGPDHGTTLVALNNLATVLADLGRSAEAADMQRESLETSRRVHGPDHQITRMALSNLGAVLADQGRYAEAEEVLAEVFEICRRAMGPEHPETLYMMNNLATIYYYQEKYAEAEDLHRQTLEIRERVLGAEHPLTLLSLNNLANSIKGPERIAETTALNEKVLAARQRVLGPDHPATIASMNNLAQNFDRVGRHAEAYQLLKGALELYETTLGQQHPRTAVTMCNLGRNLLHQGRPADAVAIYRRALAVQESVIGIDHPHTLATLRDLAEALTVLGEHQEADQIRQQIQEIED